MGYECSLSSDARDLANERDDEKKREIVRVVVVVGRRIARDEARRYTCTSLNNAYRHYLSIHVAISTWTLVRRRRVSLTRSRAICFSVSIARGGFPSSFRGVSTTAVVRCRCIADLRLSFSRALDSQRGKNVISFPRVLFSNVRFFFPITFMAR